MRILDHYNLQPLIIPLIKQSLCVNFLDLDHLDADSVLDDSN